MFIYYNIYLHYKNLIFGKRKSCFLSFCHGNRHAKLENFTSKLFSRWNNNNNWRRLPKISFYRLHSRPTTQVNTYVYKLKFWKFNYTRGAFAESETMVSLNQKLHLNVISFIIPEQRMIDILGRLWVKTKNDKIIIILSCLRNNMRTL